MPFNRPRYLRNVVFYQIYVRNHGANGTFKDVQSDLKRIQSLGVDIIYLLPIHPIGQLNKKGSLGCPYAIRDYRAINSDYGTEQDFKDLVDAIQALARSPQQAIAWTALAAFNSGPFFIHAGQESAAVTTPSLFEIDKVKWDDYTLQDTLTALAKLKKEQAQLHGRLHFITAEPVITAVWHHGSDSLFGIFNVETRQGMLSLPLPDGKYQELLSNKQITVKDNQIELPESAYIFRCAMDQEPKEFSSQLLDFNVS